MGNLLRNPTSGSPEVLHAPETWPAPVKTLISIMLNANQPMYIAWGSERRIVYNDAYVPILGDRHPNALGQKVFDVWHETTDSLLPLVDGVFAGQPSQGDHIELQLLRGGRLVDAHFSFFYAPVYGDGELSATVIGLFCACQEITERIVGARETAAAIERQRRLFEAAPGFIAILQGPEHVFEYANNAYRQAVQYREILGKKVCEALPELVLQGFVSLLDEVFVTGERYAASNTPVKLQVNPDALPVNYTINFIFEPIKDAFGCVTGIFFQGQDVTAETQALQAVQTAHRRYRSILDAMSEGFVVLDEQYRVTEINAEGLRLDGRNLDAMLNQTSWQLWPVTVGTQVETAYRAAMDRRQKQSVVYNFPSETYDIWLDLRIYPVDGGGVAAFYRDVSEAKRDELALRQADRRKDDFLATLAHELRNPLAPMRTAAKLLQQQKAVTPAVVERCANILVRQTQNMALLLEDLLDISRITSGRLELRKETITLTSILQAAIETARPALEAKKHVFVLECPAKTIELEADPLRLAQVLTNLLNNAAKYTDSGGEIVLRAELMPEGLSLSVTDNGIGIEPAALQQIFTMFSQVRSAIDRSEGGLGIGLSLARGLVELHGGSMCASSAGLGRGTQLEVKLPIHLIKNTDVDRALEKTEPKDDESSIKSSLLVLVVDDNRDAAETLSFLLSIEGHEVQTFFSGADALQWLKNNIRGKAPDAALLDIGMSDMTGYELAQKIRELPDFQHMLLVAVTGWSQDRDKQRAFSAGFNQHMSKPIDPDALLENLPLWVEKNRSAVQL